MEKYKHLMFFALKQFLANLYGWFKADTYQEHGVVCETSIVAQPPLKQCKKQRTVWKLFICVL